MRQDAGNRRCEEETDVQEVHDRCEADPGDHCEPIDFELADAKQRTRSAERDLEILEADSLEEDVEDKRLEIEQRRYSRFWRFWI